MDYELAKQLKDAGFPQSPYMNQLCQHEYSKGCNFKSFHDPECNWVSVPTLSELIEACGNDFEALIKQAGGWVAISNKESYMMKQEFKATNSPEEAVAKLWLELNKK